MQSFCLLPSPGMGSPVLLCVLIIPRLPTHILTHSISSCPSSFRCFSSHDVFTSNIAPVLSRYLKSHSSCLFFPSVWNIPYVVLFLRLIITKGDIHSPLQAVSDFVPGFPAFLSLPPTILWIVLHISEIGNYVQFSEMSCSFIP